MKRILSLVMAMLLTLASFTGALATTHTDGATLAVRDNDFSVFVGWNNYPYRSDSIAPLCEMEVRSVLYGDLNRVVFTTVDEGNQHEFDQGASILWSLDLQDVDGIPRAIAWIVGDAISAQDDALIYYVDQSTPHALNAFLPYQGSYAQAVDLGAPIEAIVRSVDGVYLHTAANVYLYQPATGMATDVTATAASANAVQAYAAFETILDGAGNLSMRLKGQSETIAIDTGVQAVTAASGVVYYIKGNDLMAYRYSESGSRRLGSFGETMLPQLVSDGTATVFALGSSRSIYRFNALSGVLEAFAGVSADVAVPTLCYSAPDLLIYDAAADTGMMTFVSAMEVAASNAAPAQIAGAPLLPEATAAPAVEPTAEPAAESTAAPVEKLPDLSKGSRGDEVLKLQQILKEQGYPVGKPDGIYGSNTVNAVKYLQYDMGVKQTGAVSGTFLKELEEADDLPVYEKYVQLQRGDKGYRVSVMQSRLKALNWLSGKADGDYGSATEKAVKNFQKAAGLTSDGIAGVHTLKALFAKDAPEYVKPEPKKETSSGPVASAAEVDEDVLVHMVRWMNNNMDPQAWGWKEFNLKHAVTAVQQRLVQLGYMKKKQVTKVFDDTTLLALKHFQNDNDILPHPTGEPDTKTLGQLFPISIR